MRNDENSTNLNEMGIEVLSDYGKLNFESGFHKLSLHREFIGIVTEKKRVAVTGATGWIGRNFLPQLSRTSKTQLFSRIPRAINIQGVSYRTQKMPMKALEIEADLLFDFAFHRKDVKSDISPMQANSQNERLLEFSMKLMASESIGKYVGVSSGAAKVEGKGEYGAQKRNLERIFFDASRKDDRLLRLWAMTGLHPSEREQFAAVDFVRGALFEGKIQITSDVPVFRSYSNVTELLALTMNPALNEKIIESGGKTIEMMELANIISSLVSHQVQIEVLHPSREDSSAIDYYAPPSDKAKELLESIGVSPMTIEEQLALMIFNMYSSRRYGSL